MIRPSSLHLLRYLSLEQVLIFGTVAVVYNFEIDFSDLVNLNSIGSSPLSIIVK